MRNALYLGLLITAGICAICLVLRYRSVRPAFRVNKSAYNLRVQVDPYPIPSGSWVSVINIDDSLGACVKKLDTRSLGGFQESSANKKDAVNYLKQTPMDREAWLVGHGIPGEIFTNANESISDNDVADFDGMGASKLRLFGCWTGALDEGARLVSHLYAHTKHDVWAQNSEVFCVPGNDKSSFSKLYIYHKSKPVEANPGHPVADVVPQDLFNPTPDEIWLSDDHVMRPVFPDKFIVTNLARVAPGAFDKKEFLIAPEDRALKTNQFVKTVDFSHPFQADPAGNVAIPLARPMIQVTFEIEGKPRTFTVYGGALLGDDLYPDTFYRMDLRNFNDLSKDLESKYPGLLE